MMRQMSTCSACGDSMFPRHTHYHTALLVRIGTAPSGLPATLCDACHYTELGRQAGVQRMQPLD